jgi:dTDP-D-glucose 4,6-dehydratase
MLKKNEFKNLFKKWIKITEKKLGWKPRVSMDDAIAKTVGFYLKDRTPAQLTLVP